jgi:hypothetical protein
VIRRKDFLMPDTIRRYLVNPPREADPFSIEGAYESGWILGKAAFVDRSRRFISHLARDNPDLSEKDEKGRILFRYPEIFSRLRTAPPTKESLAICQKLLAARSDPEVAQRRARIQLALDSWLLAVKRLAFHRLKREDIADGGVQHDSQGRPIVH